MELAQKAYQLNVQRGFESDLALVPEPDLTQQATVDPRVNRIYEQLEHKVKEAQAAMKTAEDDLKATQFRQDSDVGVEVMAEARRNLEYNTLLGSKVGSQQPLHTLPCRCSPDIYISFGLKSFSSLPGPSFLARHAAQCRPR